MFHFIFSKIFGTQKRENRLNFDSQISLKYFQEPRTTRDLQNLIIRMHQNHEINLKKSKNSAKKSKVLLNYIEDLRLTTLDHTRVVIDHQEKLLRNQLKIKKKIENLKAEKVKFAASSTERYEKLAQDENKISQESGEAAIQMENHKLRIRIEEQRDSILKLIEECQKAANLDKERVKDGENSSSLEEIQECCDKLLQQEKEFTQNHQISN